MLMLTISMVTTMIMPEASGKTIVAVVAVAVAVVKQLLRRNPSVTIAPGSVKWMMREYAGVVCRLGCGEVIKRIDVTENEESICCKRGKVPCTNAGCTVEIPAPLLAAHQANDCPYQTVDCPFKSVGCTERLLRKDVQNHTDTMSNQHMLLLLQDNRTLRVDNQSLRQDNQSFRQDNQSLQQKVGELEQSMKREDDELLQDVSALQQQLDVVQGKFSRQPQEIVFRVNVADLLQAGEFFTNSPAKLVGPYSVNVAVKKANGGNGLNVCLHLTDGLFPCRISLSVEVVNWDQQVASIRRVDFTQTYALGDSWGATNLLQLNELFYPTYVKNGHVTFIAKFQILPLE